jgi:photosystem II stability/assembly factor-like uncharacterized protein
MKFIHRFSVIAVMLVIQVLPAHSQAFVKNTSGRALTFKEIQLQFGEFKKKNDLNSEKYWKHFKRYEADMQLHTNGRGEPDGFAEYIEEAIKASEERKSNSSAPWYPVGPYALPNNLTGYMENGVGRVNCVAFHPTDTMTFYVGVAQGGLWKTTDGGARYTPLTDNLPITRISDICIDPANPSHIYISLCDFEYIGKGLYLDGKKRHTHYGLGVYETTDGGATWSPTGLTFQLTNGDASLICKILVKPSVPSSMLACGASGMYRSTDGGASWTKKLDSLFWDMVQDPVNPDIIYAATGWVKNSNLGHAGIYKSTDFGSTWTKLVTGIPMQGTVQRLKLAIAPTDPNYIYALACDNTDGFYGIYRSTNSGSTWTYQPPQLNILENDTGNNTGGQGPYDLALIVSKSNRDVIFTGGINIWGSSDGGATFLPASYWKTNYGPTLHGDIHSLQRQPVTGHLIACTDGGIYRTNAVITATWGTQPWPTVWENLSNGMQVTSFYRLSSSRNSAGRLCAGAQDNATFYYNAGNWSTIFGGDGMDNVLEVNGPNIVGSSQYGNFYYSDDGGNSGYYMDTNPLHEQAEWVTPVVADYSHPGVMYIGNENIVKTIDGGQNWTPLASIYSNPQTQQNTEISALAVSNVNSNVIYAGRRVRHELAIKGIVMKSVNGGISFTNITTNLPDSLYYTGIECSPTNSNEAVVCMAGFAAGYKVFRTTNGGTSWTNISLNLPNIPVACVKYIPGSVQMMVATDVGVYILNAGSTSWYNYSNGLPNVIVSDIEFNPVLNRAYISTFGRGIWETNLSQILAGIEDVAPTPLDFSVFPTLCDGNFNIGIANGKNQLDIFDVQGKIIHSEMLNPGNNPIHLERTPGLYYLRVSGDHLMGVKKVVVQ